MFYHMSTCPPRATRSQALVSSLCWFRILWLNSQWERQFQKKCMMQNGDCWSQASDCPGPELDYQSLGSKLGHVSVGLESREKLAQSRRQPFSVSSLSSPSWPLSPTGLSPLISDTHPQKIRSSGAPGSTTSLPQSPGPTAPQPAASQPSVGPWHAPGSKLQARCPAGGKEKGQNRSRRRTQQKALPEQT